jgi:hypothetical protein
VARVGVNINVNDLSESGLRSLRENIRRVDAQIRGAGGRINVTLNDRDTVEGADRIQRAIREIPNHVRVRVRISESGGDSNRTVRGIRRVFAPVQGLVSGMLEDGVGQGLLEGFKNAAKNPAVLAAFVLIIESTVALVGAALAGVLVFAFGAAFVGLGGFLASKSKEVKKHWKSAADDIKSAWKNAGGAMEPVVNHGIDLLTKLSNAFLPHFKEAMANSAAPVQSFLDSVAKGIIDFGKRAFDPMMEGFNALLLAFGPAFDDFMRGLGDSFGALGRTVSSHSGEIAMALKGILGLITTLIDVINFFAQAWVVSLRIIHTAIGSVEIALAGLLDGITYVIARSLDQAADMAHAFGLDALGDRLDTARDKVTAWADDATNKLYALGQKSLEWGAKMDVANKKRKLQVDITGWTTKLAEARAKLKKTTGQKARAKLTADISNLSSKIAQAKQKLRSLNGATATTYVQLFRKATSADRNADGVPDSIARRTGGVVGMATGGLARASMAARGVLVGEAGPEILHGVPAGSRVTPAGRTRSLMGQGGGGGGTYNINVVLDGKVIAKATFDPWREEVRNRGGIGKVVPA